MIEFNFNPFPELTTERLLLRRITDADLPALFAMRRDRKIMQYIDRPIAVTIDDALALLTKMDDLIDTNEGINWAITIQGKPEMIGNIGYYRSQREHHRSEIGYMMIPECEGKGIMHEAMNACIKYGFGPMGLHTIEGVVNPANDKSIKVLERCGFVREGYYKENYYFNGTFLDTGVYSLLKPKDI
jgi:ribosomal-protein-alanine N-acetyltransferase